MAQHKSPKNVTDLCNDVVTKRFGQRRRTPRGHKKLSDLGEKSHSKTEEPAMSTKELLLEKTGMGKSSSGRGGTWNVIMQIKYLCNDATQFFFC